MFRAMHFLLYFSIFFPFIKLAIDFGTDQQPYALIISAVIVGFYVIRSGKWPRQMLVMLLVCIVALFVGGFQGINAIYFRSLANYLSLFLITFAVYIDSVTYKGPDERFIKIAICLWTLTGLVQRFINRAFMTSLLSASRTSLDRGVVSLAVEPTTYGLFCLLLMIVCWEYFESGKVFYSALCLFQIIFLAQSSMAVLLLVVLALYVGIVYFAFSLRATTKIGVISVVGLGLICGYFFVNRFLFGTRVHVLVMAIFRDPLQVLRMDASVNDRASHIYFSLRGALDNYLLPNGFNAWRQYVTAKSAQQTTFFWVSKGDRIMSGYGAALFELGLFGLLLLAATTLILLKSNIEFKRRIVYTLFIQTIIFTAIPIGFPPYPFLLGIFLFSKTRTVHNKAQGHTTP